MKGRLPAILTELKSHAPFTLFGSLTGVICMLIFRDLTHQTSHKIFYVFHPGHVLLSAIVIASLFELYSNKSRFIVVLIVGCAGSVGVGTLSDSLIPYAGELVLGMHIGHSHGTSPATEQEDTAEHEDIAEHARDYAHEHEAEQKPESFADEAHIGFIEGWYVVIPAAIAGVLIAYFRPKTKFPHAGHVLLSTWASSFHMLMAMGGDVSWLKMIGSFGFLFLAVWIPCCFSDIVFPLLFVRSGVEVPHCHHH
ncbi:MAG: hypothetical protein JSW47_10905 [Phycisphaerales bacterium]|nr:MAG: hypothetical protein JSW47_10905 [Phycisphaerales bacterium]